MRKPSYAALVKKAQASAKRAPPRIVVVGDVMLDTHVTCDVAGISPEDDLAYKLKPVMTCHRLGGAGNVAANLLTLGARPSLLGCIGQDTEGDTLCQLLHTEYGLTTSWIRKIGYCTTHKLRYVTKHNRHVIRVDREMHYELPPSNIDGLLIDIAEINPKLIIVSDYAKGLVNPQLMQGLRQLRIPFIVDPKRSITSYCGALAVTPNEREYKQYFPVRQSVPRLLQQARIGHMLAKLSERGALLWSNRTGYTGLISAHARTHGDPAGCGDSLIAGLALGLAWGWNMEDAARLGVAAGSCAFDHTGVYTVTLADVLKELSKGEADELAS